VSVLYVNPKSHPEPAGQYSHVAIAGPGRLAFIAGQVALDAEGSLVGGDDVGEQFRQVFANLKAVTEGIGAALTDIVELRTFLVGADSLPSFRAARGEVFDEHFPDGGYPPNTLLVISGLASPQLKVEVSAIALLAD
jgi:enamine deaminase RidA (YjgF/YER057c/UK114 family)